MSRIGKEPITVPSQVKVTVDDQAVVVAGPGGQLSQSLLPAIKVKLEGDQLLVSRSNDERQTKAGHGLLRSLLANMVVGVDSGFSKKLEVNGIGFKVRSEGKHLVLNLGFSHEVKYLVPDDLKVSCEGNTITVSGIDKQRVGQVAAEIRALKKPEPYKGKGIKYQDEVIVRKAGKGAKE